MYGYILKKINLIIPLLIICFFIAAKCSFAAPPPNQKAPVQQTAPAKATPAKTAPAKTAPAKTATDKAAPAQTTPAKTATDKTATDKTTKPTEENKQEQADSKNPNEGDSKTTEQTPKTVEQEESPLNPIEEFLKPYGLNIMHVGIIGGVLILLIIVVIIMSGKGKQKSVCQKCGGKVLPGNTICEKCKNEEMMAQMDNNMGQIQQPQSNTFGTPTNSIGTGVNTDTGDIPSQSAVPPVTNTSTPPPPMAKKVAPTGRVVAQLSIRKGLNNGYRFKYYESQNQVSIGTDKECDFQLEDEAAEDDKLPKIASRHAVITLENGSTFTIHDISTTGMFVNNTPVKQQLLKTGDVIKIGTTELTFARL